MIGITGRKKLIIQTVHNKRVARSRVAAKQAHENLIAISQTMLAMEEMESGADARSTQERGVAKPKREVMN